MFWNNKVNGLLSGFEVNQEIFNLGEELKILDSLLIKSKRKYKENQPANYTVENGFFISPVSIALGIQNFADFYGAFARRFANVLSFCKQKSEQVIDFEQVKKDLDEVYKNFTLLTKKARAYQIFCKRFIRKERWQEIEGFLLQMEKEGAEAFNRYFEFSLLSILLNGNVLPSSSSTENLINNLSYSVKGKKRKLVVESVMRDGTNASLFQSLIRNFPDLKREILTGFYEGAKGVSNYKNLKSDFFDEIKNNQEDIQFYKRHEKALHEIKRQLPAKNALLNLPSSTLKQKKDLFLFQIDKFRLSGFARGLEEDVLEALKSDSRTEYLPKILNRANLLLPLTDDFLQERVKLEAYFNEVILERERQERREGNWFWKVVNFFKRIFCFKVNTENEYLADLNKIKDNNSMLVTEVIIQECFENVEQKSILISEEIEKKKVETKGQREVLEQEKLVDQVPPAKPPRGIFIE